MRPRIPHLFGIASLLALTTACASGGTAADVPTETTALSVTTTELPTTTTLEPTTTVAPDVAPPELRGVWTTELNANDTMRLTLRGSLYEANIEGSSQTGTGRIAVEGDTIEFHGSEFCADDPGVVYTWAIEDGTLTFTATEDDPCGHRASFLGYGYTLLSALP